MAAGARVFTRMAIRGGVAAQRCAAALTGAEMYPGGSDLGALLALPALRPFDVADCANVRAGFWHAA